MQQRQLRLGDILDDYCPRERRVTNHAIVAMIDQDIKQTRCVTCDAEHEYKQARVPPQRKKKAAGAPGALYQDVLEGMPRRTPLQVTARRDEEADAVEADEAAPELAVPLAVGNGAEAPPAEETEGPVHRPLIRATLPRHEGQPPARPLPEFTARTVPTRPQRFRQAGNGRGERNGNVASPGFRAGGRRGADQGHGGRSGHPNRAARPGQGERPGQGSHRRRGGKKRSK